MRTTLSIDDDVLAEAKAIAHQRGESIGEVLSALARKALRKPQPEAHRNGVPLLPRRDAKALVTLEDVNKLRDEGS